MSRGGHDTPGMEATGHAAPRGTLCEAGALIVVRDGEAHRYEQAVLLTFDRVEQLQQALEDRCCAWRFQREDEQSAS